MYFTNDDLQAANIPSDLEAIGFRGNGIRQIAEYGFDIGGPILKNRLWFWGAWAANDIRQVAVSEPARPTIYLHNLQNSRVKTTIVARTAGDPLPLTEAVQQAVWSVDPLQPITAVFTFDDAVSRALSQPRRR